MYTKSLIHAAALFALPFATLPLAEAQLPPPVFQGLELIDEIDASADIRREEDFTEYPANVSRVEEVFGTRVRVLHNDKGDVKYFGYRIGRGKGLEANGTYVLEVEYPEDKPRSITVMNMGNETIRGFHTGNTGGDALKPRYVHQNVESLEIPLSGRFEKSQMLMHLQDRTAQTRGKRGAEILDESKVGRVMKPEDGFWVYFTQFAPDQDPLSAGTAISKIRLYKAPPFEDFAMPINFPPAGLPKRHLFFREEMADGVIGSNPENRGFDDTNNWYVGKARLLRFLGMNTMGKDLLEFGANQGWDSAKFGGNRWVFQSHEPGRWERLLDICKQYGLSVLPYYEYAGSKGQQGLGNERRAIPLSGDTYTHIKWAETARADLTDPDTFEDFRKMLEITVADVKDRAEFVGVWLRPRSSQLPISFSDSALARFSAETGQGATVTREQLKKDKRLYGAYIAWWEDARKEFFIKIRDYLRSSGVDDAVVLYTADPSEPGVTFPGGDKSGVVAEDPAAWTQVDLKNPPAPLDRAIDERWSFEGQTQPRGTWGQWEWHHAVPRHDPENYKDVEGVLPTFGFNRAYTVGDSEALEAFETLSGMAMVRHYSLNENMMRIDKAVNGKDLDPIGYFVTDFERTGPFIMLAEARAMANGNPTHIGYMASNNFNRTFPQYVRAFNAAFLSLPALPSEVVPGAASDPEVVVRRIDAGGHGTWLAVVNPGYRSKNVTVKLPVAGSVTNAATGEAVSVSGGRVTLYLYPCQLVALRIL
ncbi:MAG: hypothetical protein PF795_13615 [Kiritimatiellae bacterium]|nr:hypothetical protein [Kiritimatiellia bacterium]